MGRLTRREWPHGPSRNPGRERPDESQPRRVKTPAWVDPQTGLEWQCESPGRMTWYEALKYAGSLSLSGKHDWRLPTAAELETMIDRSILFDQLELRPAMRKDVPFRDNLSYWSSTTFAPDTYSAWIVMFEGAYILSYYKTNRYHVRCVRV